MGTGSWLRGLELIKEGGYTIEGLLIFLCVGKPRGFVNRRVVSLTSFLIGLA